MIPRLHVTPIALALLAFTSAPLLAAAGPAGHPLVRPFEGSKLSGSKLVEFDEYDVPVGKSEKGKPPMKHLEGKITTLSYANPKNRSALEIWRNYEEAFKKAHFEQVFACRGKECGGWMKLKWLGGYPKGDDGWYAAWKLAGKDGEAWVALGVSPVIAELVIIEPKAMETGRVGIDSAALVAGLEQEGHVAIYGIYFDSGKADVKTESTPALEQIASVLKKDAARKLVVVGHTDNQGEAAMNLDLSKRRAASVVASLTTRHGIATERLRAEGVGSLAPVATNRTDEGRAKNRRVELVEP